MASLFEKLVDLKTSEELIEKNDPGGSRPLQGETVEPDRRPTDQR